MAYKLGDFDFNFDEEVQISEGITASKDYLNKIHITSDGRKWICIEYEVKLYETDFFWLRLVE